MVFTDPYYHIYGYTPTRDVPDTVVAPVTDEYKFLVHPRIAGHGPTLYQSGLPSTRGLELVSAKPLRNGAP